VSDIAAEFEKSAVWGARRVLETASVDPEIARQIIEHWPPAYASGNPRIWRSALNELLDGVAFEWGWLDEWRAWFNRRGALPYLWRYHDRDVARFDVAMLDHAMGSAAARYREWSRAWSSQRRGFQKYGVRFSSSGCAVEDEIAALRLDQFDPGSLDTWPPYFPGDRTHVMVVSERVAKRRPGEPVIWL